MNSYHNIIILRGIKQRNTTYTCDHFIEKKYNPISMLARVFSTVASKSTLSKMVQVHIEYCGKW